jgi:hypothetical protein
MPVVAEKRIRRAKSANIRRLSAQACDGLRFLASLSGKICGVTKTPVGARGRRAPRWNRRSTPELRTASLQKPVMPIRYTAASVTIPILVLQGDATTRWRRTISAGSSRLESHGNATLRLLPALNHLFMSGVGPSKPAEYQAPGDVDPEVTDLISTFVLSRGTGRQVHLRSRRSLYPSRRPYIGRLPLGIAAPGVRS